MALELRAAVKTALGANLSVTHTGPDNVSRVISVPVVDAGVGDETPLPVVRIVGQFGNTEGSDIGGNGAHNDAFVDIHITATDGPTINAPALLGDAYAALEARLRAVQSSVGSSFFTLAASHRDFPPRQMEAGPYVYVRYVMVRGVSLETY